ISRYPDPWAGELRKDLAGFWREAGIEAENIVLGPGSMGVLERLNKMLLFPGARVLGYTPQFSEYVSDARANGAVYSGVPLTGEKLTFPLAALLARLTPEVTLVYLDNPNNPTGQLLELDTLRSILHRALELAVPVIVDEAYGDFVPPEGSALQLSASFPNLIVVRSFSKGWGLAGLRVGYAALRGELRSLYERVDLPFSLSRAAEAAARAALQEAAFMARTRTQVAAVKAALLGALKVLTPAVTYPSTPIVALTAPRPETDLRDAFLRQGVLVESGADFPGLTAATVRLRVPAEAGELLKRLQAVEAELSGK
ncbi:MAG TPA: histidinol-phosphate aminotransferase family protein, partial [Firmicutes bacterium]|nr:histidinol-phosphate aminotransferase family protein [Bacillota bacterium]